MELNIWLELEAVQYRRFSVTMCFALGMAATLTLEVPRFCTLLGIQTQPLTQFQYPVAQVTSTQFLTRLAGATTRQ
jgi:hypothetical protein